MDRSADLKREFIPSLRVETVQEGRNERAHVRSSRRQKDVCSQNALSGLGSTMNGRTSVCDDAHAELKARSGRVNPDCSGIVAPDIFDHR